MQRLVFLHFLSFSPIHTYIISPRLSEEAHLLSSRSMSVMPCNCPLKLSTPGHPSLFKTYFQWLIKDQEYRRFLTSRMKTESEADFMSTPQEKKNRQRNANATNREVERFIKIIVSDILTTLVVVACICLCHVPLSFKYLINTYCQG